MSEDETGMTPMRQAAVQMHEMYVELKRAGFTRTEAMELMARVLSAQVNEQGGDSGNS